MSFLRKCFQQAAVASDKGDDFAEELREKQTAEQYNRREFLTRSLGTIAAGGLILSLSDKINAAPTTMRIVVVGAGIAGLNAAYQLQKNQVRANITVYEAGIEKWGRIQTKDFGGGITAEMGGEFIDSDHADMLELAKEFNLDLINTAAEVKNLIKDSYFFGGIHRTEKNVIREFRKNQIMKVLQDDNRNYETEKANEVERLDNISIEQYLEKNLQIEGWFYDLLKVAYTSEFGMNIGEQSALNFIRTIATEIKTEFKIFGDSDELYKIEGGNDSLISALKNRLKNQIMPEMKLENISQRDKKYTLSFAGGKEVDADAIILALPFTALRKVDFSKNLFKPEKMKAIKELGYGTSAKLLLETNSRIWREQKNPKGRAGYLFNEKIQNGWDFSLGQTANTGRGGYTVFLGGDAGRSLDKGNAKNYLDELDRAFPGFKNSHTNSLDINWSKKDFIHGGYASYKTGQWTSISGEEVKPQGNIFFCGEHCSSDYQGYMNGGAETGRDAAAKVIKKFFPPPKKLTRKRSR